MTAESADAGVAAVERAADAIRMEIPAMLPGYPERIADALWTSGLLAPVSRPAPVDDDGLRAAIEALADEWTAEANGIEQDGTPEVEVEAFVNKACADQLRAVLAQHTADPEVPR